MASKTPSERLCSAMTSMAGSYRLSLKEQRTFQDIFCPDRPRSHSSDDSLSGTPTGYVIAHENHAVRS